ncbi:MAG: HORMA-1 domain-containing protein [Acidobacteriaceae bacterium]
MSDSYTSSETTTFTITHAKHMAPKVATDLKRLQRLYDRPNDADIANYEAEIIALLKGGYLGTVTYGFKRDGKWIAPTLRYTARDLTDASADDDDPGRVRPGSDISGASFYSFLTYSSAWDGLPSSEKEHFKRGLPFQRTNGIEPGVNGYFSEDRTYSAGGRALSRASVRSFG